jgi:sulfite exporter TauE/SafE
MFGVALLSGSALKGAEFALAFGVGTLPLLYVAQMQFFIWQKKISPLWIERLQRGMALVLGIIVLARIVYGSPLESVATIEEEKPKCPMCPSHQGN